MAMKTPTDWLEIRTSAHGHGGTVMPRTSVASQRLSCEIFSHGALARRLAGTVWLQSE